MYGFSYQGMTQLLAAAEQPEGLQCIAPGMTAHDLYHGWFYHHGALRLASALGWGMQMLKADARRLKLREASDRLEQAWANLPSQTSVLPFRAHPALHGEGLPQYVLDWFDHDGPGRVLVVPGREPVVSEDRRSRAARLWLVRHVSPRQHRLASRAHQSCGQLLRSRAPIPDRRALAAHSLGRPHRRGGLRPRSAARHRRHPASLVQPLAQGFRGIRRRAAHSPFCSRRKSLAPGRRLARAARGTRSIFTATGKPIRAREMAHSRRGSPHRAALRHFRPRSRSARPFPGARRAGRAVRPGLARTRQQSARLHSEPLAHSLHIFGTPQCRSIAPRLPAHADFTAKLVRVRPGGAAEFICIGIARSSWLFAESGYIADRVHLWEFDLEPTSCFFAAGDSHSSGDRRQRFSALRPQSRHGRALVPRHVLGLAALDADRLPRREAPLRALFAGERAWRMNGANLAPQIEISVRQQALRQHRPVLEGIDLTIAQGRIRQPHRSFGLRQIDGPQTDLGTDVSDHRRDSRRRHDARRTRAKPSPTFFRTPRCSLAYRAAERRPGAGTRRRQQNAEPRRRRPRSARSW